MSDEPDKPKIIIDEDWKARAQAEKERWAQEAEAAKTQPSATSGSSQAGALPPLPPPSFAGLCQMLATQAIASLTGIAEGDAPPQPRPDEARWFIDLLGVLEEKSHGNLTPAEAQMINGLLHELRMAFISQQKTSR